jgi:hypothetical protein
VTHNVPKLLIEQKHRLEPDLEKIGDTWQDMLRVVSWTTQQSRFFSIPTNDAWGKEVVIWGETLSGCSGGFDVHHLLLSRPHSTLIISGGLYGNENFSGEMGALDLFEKLKESLRTARVDDQKIKERVIIDSASIHTGHQRVILGSLLTSLAPDVVWVVMPVYHITRFLMSVGLPLYDKKFQPYICPLPYGAWNTRHPLIGPLHESTTFTHEELFALPPTPDRNRKGKLNCGELDKILMYADPKERQCLTFRQARDWLRI